MRAKFSAALLSVLSGCALFAGSERPPVSPAALAHPVVDPALLETPQGASQAVPIEQVSVRVRRGSEGRLTIVEFLSPGLPESEQVALRLAVEAGEVRVAGQGAPGEDSWITTLQGPRAR